MNGSKKTLTTLAAAATMALGGIAIAQTTGSDNTAAGASLGSSSTMQNSGDQSLNYGSSPSTDASSTANTTAPASSDTSTLGASADTSAQPAQVDRN